MKIDGITHLSPRLDGASTGFASDLVSIGDKAAAELFGKLSKIDLIAFFDEDSIALFGARRPSPGQIKGSRLRRKKLVASEQDAQSSRSAQVEHCFSSFSGAASVSRYAASSRRSTDGTLY